MTYMTTWIRRCIGSYGCVILRLGGSSQVHWTVTPTLWMLWIFLLTVALWLAGHATAQSSYGTPPPGRRKVNLSSVVHMSLGSNSLRPVNLALLPMKIFKYGTLTEGSVWLNSRATPTSTTVGTGRSPGLVMASISSQQVIEMIPSSALGTPPRGNRLEIPGLAMMIRVTSIILS